jgi:hypothetical protein
LRASLEFGVRSGAACFHDRTKLRCWGRDEKFWARREGSGGLEEEAGFAQEVFGAAGFVDEFEGAVIEGGVVLHLCGVTGVGGEHEDLAVGLLGVEFVGELEAGFEGHGDVAQEEAGGEGSGAGEAVGRGVGGFGVIAIGFEDEVEGVSDHVVVVDDQNSLLHGRPRARRWGAATEKPGWLAEEQVKGETVLLTLDLLSAQKFLKVKFFREIHKVFHYGIE